MRARSVSGSGVVALRRASSVVTLNLTLIVYCQTVFVVVHSLTSRSTLYLYVYRKGYQPSTVPGSAPGFFIGQLLGHFSPYK